MVFQAMRSRSQQLVMRQLVRTSVVLLVLSNAWSKVTKIFSILRNATA